MYQTPFSDQIRNEAGIATMCVGAITTADQVNTIVAAGRADLVALAAPASGRSVLHHEGGGLVRRRQTSIARRNISGRDQIFRNSRARPRGPDRS